MQSKPRVHGEVTSTPVHSPPRLPSWASDHHRSVQAEVKALGSLDHGDHRPDSLLLGSQSGRSPKESERGKGRGEKAFLAERRQAPCFLGFLENSSWSWTWDQQPRGRRGDLGVQGRGRSAGAPRSPCSSAGTRVPHLVRFHDVVFRPSGIPRVLRTSPARGQVSVF